MIPHGIEPPRDSAPEASEALNVVAAKAWGILVGGDLSQRATWDQVMAWVHVGQRLVDDPDPQLVSRLTSALPQGRAPRGW